MLGWCNHAYDDKVCIMPVLKDERNCLTAEKKGRKKSIHCSSKRLNIVSIDLNRFDTSQYNIMIARQSYWLLFSCSNQIKPGHFTCKVS